MPPTAYGRLMERIKREEARQERDKGQKRYAARRATLVGIGGPKRLTVKSPNAKLEREVAIKRVKPTYCGAKRRDGKSCRQPAGYGTNHYGMGACMHHGGATPSYNKKINREIAQREAILLGAPKEINPLDAIIWCIQIKAGEVEWLSEKMSQLNETEWVENSIAGKRFHLFARQRDEATKSLVDFSKIAISLGLAERAVKLAEQYGAMLANLIKGILADLNLTPQQQIEAPAIVRKHLILVQGGLQQGALPRGYEEEQKAS